MKVSIYTDDGDGFIFKDESANEVAIQLEALLQGSFTYKEKWVKVKNEETTTVIFTNHIVGFTIE